MVKMTDVAKRANVSIATVSRVLNNKEDVNEDTRKRILEIIEEMNYKPNQVARTLYKKNSNLIAVIVPDLINPYYPEIIQAIETTFKNQGYHILLYNTSNDIEKENWHIETISSMMIDGVILISPTMNTEKYDELRVPIISIDGIANKSIQYIASNYYKGAQIAVQKLIENNCKNILHIAGPQNLSSAVMRFKGFNEEVIKYDVSYDNLISKIIYNENKKIIKDYLIKNRNIDGIFASNDSIAFTVVKVLNELNISIPKDIKLIGFDNNYMSEMITPALSTISQPIYDIGVKAANVLIDNIQMREINKENIIFDIQYIKRDTTIV